MMIIISISSSISSSSSSCGSSSSDMVVVVVVVEMVVVVVCEREESSMRTQADQTLREAAPELTELNSTQLNGRVYGSTPLRCWKGGIHSSEVWEQTDCTCGRPRLRSSDE